MKPRLTAGFACAVAILAAAACGGKDGSPQGIHPAAAGPLLTGQASAPPPPSALRAGAGLTETLIQGQFTLLRSAGAADNGTALELDAGSSAMEWGLYAFDPAGNAPDSLAVSLDAQGGAWIGLADYAAGAWEWHGPFAAGKTFAVDEARYLAPDGVLYCTVLAEGGSSATVSALSVRTINPQNEAPSAAFSPSATTGNAPLSVDFDASASTDSDGQIVEYAWDWDGEGLYDGFSDQPLATHVFTQPGIYDVALRVSDEQFGRATASVSINVGVAGNSSPSASFTTTPAAGECNVKEPVSFDATASNDTDGSLVRYDWDFDGDGSWDGYDRGAQPSHTFYVDGVYDARLRVTDNQGAQDMDTLTLEVGPVPPSAAFTPSVTSGLVPLDVQFDASASSDSNGYIVSYEWDWDGDGDYDALSAVPQTPHTYIRPGQFPVGLRVTDDSGASATASADISAVLYPTTIGDAGGAPVGLSMELVNEMPAWAYYDVANTALNYRRALNEAGTELADTITVDNSADVGRYPSLAVVNDNPAIAYIDATNTQLMFCRASGVNGGTWNAPVIASPDADIRGLHLAVVNGKPAIGYASSGDITYIQALDANGATWNTPVTIHAGNTPVVLGLEVVSGNPALAYWEISNVELQYVRATDADGTTWGSQIILQSGNSGLNGCLAVFDGVPAVAYQSATALKLVKASDANGASWAAPVIIDGESNTGAYAWLTVYNSVPAISYFRNGMLAYIRGNDAAATSWGNPVVINPDADANWSQIRDVGGELTISAFQSTGELYYFWGL